MGARASSLGGRTLREEFGVMDLESKFKKSLKVVASERKPLCYKWGKERKEFAGCGTT